MREVAARQPSRTSTPASPGVFAAGGRRRARPPRPRPCWPARRRSWSSRRAAGLVRHCHGDLHLANIVLLDDRPVPVRLHRVRRRFRLHRRALRPGLPAHGPDREGPPPPRPTACSTAGWSAPATMPAWPCCRCSSRCAPRSAPRSWASPSLRGADADRRRGAAATSRWPPLPAPPPPILPRHRRRLRHRQDHARPSPGARPARPGARCGDPAQRRHPQGPVRPRPDRAPPARGLRARGLGPRLRHHRRACRHLPRRRPLGDRGRGLRRTRAARGHRGGRAPPGVPFAGFWLEAPVADRSSTASPTAPATPPMPTPPSSAARPKSIDAGVVTWHRVRADRPTAAVAAEVQATAIG